MLREDATSGQREAVLSDALSQVFRLARDARKPLVAEDLDFRAKKKARGARPVPRLLVWYRACSMPNIDNSSWPSATVPESN